MDLSVIGVNAPGHESGNDQMCNGRDLPWQQDTPAVDAWTQWAVEYRDVYVVDAAGQRQYRYNLSTYDLADAANREQLKALILDVAE